MEDTKGLVIAVTQVLFEIDNFNVTMGLTLLINVFYVNYPSLSPTCMYSFLLFVQEHLIGIKHSSNKHSQKCVICTSMRIGFCHMYA